MILKYSLLTALIVSLTINPVSGDTVRTRSGAVYDGDVQLDVLLLKVRDGEIEVPRSAIRSVRAAGRGFEILLSDDTTVVGVPVVGILRVSVGVIVRSIPFDDVELIELSAVSPEKEIRQALEAGEFARASLVTPEMGTFETSCPMRLELKLPSEPLSAWRSSELRPFRCDGAVSVLVVAIETRPPRRGVAHLQMEFFVMVGPPQDKRSHLGVEFLLDGEVVGKGGKGQVSTEEGRLTPVSFSLDLPSSAYGMWKAGGRNAVLRLTLTAVDD